MNTGSSTVLVCPLRERIQKDCDDVVQMVNDSDLCVEIRNKTTYELSLPEPNISMLIRLFYEQDDEDDSYNPYGDILNVLYGIRVSMGQLRILEREEFGKL
jgi:hypothetical protein